MSFVFMQRARGTLYGENAQMICITTTISSDDPAVGSGVSTLPGRSGAKLQNISSHDFAVRFRFPLFFIHLTPRNFYKLIGQAPKTC